MGKNNFKSDRFGVVAKVAKILLLVFLKTLFADNLPAQQANSASGLL